MVAASTGSYFRELYASRPNMSLPRSGRPALRSCAMCFEGNALLLCLALSCLFTRIQTLSEIRFWVHTKSREDLYVVCGRGRFWQGA